MEINKPPLLHFLIRVAFIHLLCYSGITAIFLIFQNTVLDSLPRALELYQPFRGPGIINISGQILRGLAFGLIFYPFYNLIFKKRNGYILLFLSMWGVALIGSVEPQPGSIEGLIYTFISFPVHLSVIAATGVQFILFTGLFVSWERRLNSGFLPEESGETSGLFPHRKKIKGYTTRFIIVHLITYWVIGGIFYQISGYQEALETMEIFELWRELENLPAVLLVFFGQIGRGTMLALFLYPFYHSYIMKKHGWLLLYLLMGGLTILGSPIFLTEFITPPAGLSEFLKDLVVGIPEIVTQMLIFSLIFFFWQRRAEIKQDARNKP